MAAMIISILVLPIYAIVFLIIATSQYIRYRSLPWTSSVINIGCIAVFFYLQNRVEDHEMVFYGTYTKADDWGAGLANVGTTLINQAVLLGLFVVTQVIFWMIFNKGIGRIKHLADISASVSSLPGKTAAGNEPV